MIDNNSDSLKRVQTAVNHITKAITEPEIYKYLAEALVKYFDFSHVTIRKVDWEKGVLSLMSYLGFTEEVPTVQLPLSEWAGGFGEVATKGKSLAAFEGEEVSPDLRLALKLDNLHNLTPLPSLAIIPIKVKGRVIIVLAAEGKKDGRGINVHDKEILDLFSEMTGAALENVFSQEELETELIRDKLTGLLNKDYFMKRLSEEFKRAKRYDIPLSCCIFDIDDFKSMNHSYANILGDQVLQQIGRLIPAMVRHSDIVARYSEKQFVVLFTHTVLENAMIVAEEISRFISALTFPFGGKELRVTARFGISEYPMVNAKKPADLLYYADMVLRERKKPYNRNCALVHTENGIRIVGKAESLFGQSEIDSFIQTEEVPKNENITAFEIFKEKTEAKKKPGGYKLLETDIHAIARILKDWHSNAKELADTLNMKIEKLKRLEVVTQLAMKVGYWGNFFSHISKRETLIRLLTLGIILQIIIITVFAHNKDEKHIFKPRISVSNSSIQPKSNLSLEDLLPYNSDEIFKQITLFGENAESQGTKEEELMQIPFKEAKKFYSKHRTQKGSRWRISKEKLEQQVNHPQTNPAMSPIASRKEESLKEVLKRAYLYYEF